MQGCASGAGLVAPLSVEGARSSILDRGLHTLLRGQKKEARTASRTEVTAVATGTRLPHSHMACATAIVPRGRDG